MVESERLIKTVDFSKAVKNRLTASVAFIGNTGKGKSAACNLLANANGISDLFDENDD